MKKLVLSMMAGVLFLTGCATLQGFLAATENPILQRTVQYGVVRYLAANPDQQPEAQRVIDEVRKVVDRPAMVTVFELEQVAIEAIPWDKMDPAGQFLLMGLVADIGYYVRQQVGDGMLDEDDKVRVRDFLYWIEQAVRFAG